MRSAATMPWLVHLLTATSAVFAWLALRASVAGDLREAFLWLALTTAIDAVDGWAARAVRVKERTPAFDGARLDDIVDYLTFVFVPAWIVAWAGLVPAAWTVPVVAAMLLSSAYGFSQTAAKSSDYFFTGFPSYWNIVVLYLVAVAAGPWVNAVVLLTLAVLVFVPIGYVYPSRTPTLRGLTVGLGILWALAALVMIWQLPSPSPWIVYGSLLYAVYYVALSLVLHARRSR
jgi:phosphatidylcholine synthase